MSPIPNSLSDAYEVIRERVLSAARSRTHLRIRGGGSKDWMGLGLRGQILDVSQHSGVVDYDPSELVITARCGTSLDDLDRIVEDSGQMLGFEPPRYSSSATVGGCVASGVAGPRRLQSGPVRDFVLGVKLLDGRGRRLSFGGRVIKNVAGFDVSRLLAGSMGILGVILEVSLKVLPKPVSELSVRLEMPQSEAIVAMRRWAVAGYAISATAWQARDGVGELVVRLSGGAASVAQAKAAIGGEVLPNAEAFWIGIRDQTAEVFNLTESDTTLWRLSLAPQTPVLKFESEPLLEWSGAQRWYRLRGDAPSIRERARAHGGHATAWRRVGAHAEFLPPPEPAIHQIHQRLKTQFDPSSVLNVGRMYPDI